MGDISPRWLNPEQAAVYVGKRVDELPRLVRAGKLPRPSYHFGPKSARYDRLALDALFAGRARSAANDQEAVVAGAIQDILQGRR